MKKLPTTTVSTQRRAVSVHSATVGAPHQPDRLTRTGSTIRVVLALLTAALMIIGNQWGEDDHFPFGPFKMYASSDPLNKPVPDTRVEVVNAEGERFRLTQANSGFRRAEVEGQLPRLREHPELLASLAAAYERRRPTRPKIVRVEIVIRWWELEDGRATGAYTDKIDVVWTADGVRP